MLPHSPSAHSPRSPSSVVGSYFGTGQRAADTVEAPRQGTTRPGDDDELDFWGRLSSPGQDSESESESSSDNAMEEEDGEDDEDAMDLFGHR